MIKFRDGLIGPSVILFAICLVITLALAFTYQTTKPVIEQAEIDAANTARQEVLPGGGDFSEIKNIELPEGVLEAYKSSNGYVFKAQAKGFSGQVTYMIGMDKNGGITGINTFETNETPGLGTKVENPAYLEQYYGGANPDAIDAITGATKTSDSLKNSLKSAKEAFDIVKEVG